MVKSTKFTHEHKKTTGNILCTKLKAEVYWSSFTANMFQGSYHILDSNDQQLYNCQCNMEGAICSIRFILNITVELLSTSFVIYPSSGVLTYIKLAKSIIKNRYVGEKLLKQRN
uniref:Uncharacterized protein n=1 Tax=Rhodnius prolixus TaxID=13249 RepID=T1HSW0_RHOPR